MYAAITRIGSRHLNIAENNNIFAILRSVGIRIICFPNGVRIPLSSIAFTSFKVFTAKSILAVAGGESAYVNP
jgi:hypothetical protein